MSALSPRVAQMHMTASGLRIGIAHIPRQTHQASQDHALIQRALLDKRTAQPVSLFRVIVGKIWGWL